MCDSGWLWGSYLEGELLDDQNSADQHRNSRDYNGDCHGGGSIKAAVNLIVGIIANTERRLQEPARSVLFLEILKDSRSSAQQDQFDSHERIV